MKKFLVGLETIPEYEEFEVKARNKTEARKKAQKIIDKDNTYLEMRITDIQEVKEK